MKLFPSWAKNAHVVLFILVPLLTIYSVNTADVDAASIIRPFLGVLVGVAIAAPLVWLLAKRNVERAAWILSAEVLLLFATDTYYTILSRTANVYYYIYGWINSEAPSLGLNPVGYYRWGIGLWIVASILVLWFFLRTKRDLTATFWVAGVALLFLPCSRILSTFLAHRQGETTARKAQVAAGKVESTINADSPDLYVVVLDAYARQDIHQSEFGRDNEPFLHDLEKRGFVVARKSRSNYIQTPLCIAAALNLEYLPDQKQGVAIESVQPMIDHNAIAALLRTKGYQFLSIPTGYEMTAAPSADHIYSPDSGMSFWEKPFPSPYEELLRQGIPLFGWQNPVQTSILQQRMRIVAAFNNLGKMGEITAPKFVYAHILAPHPPFLFDENGNPVEPEGKSFSGLGDASDYNGTNDEYKRGYARQVSYVNKAVLKAIDAVQKEQKRPYVIVLMGDHGARMHTNWGSRERTDPHEATANLFAVYVPDQNGERAILAKRFQTMITSINAMRLVMNTVYGTQYSPLPNRSFYSPKFRPLAFEEITQDIDAIDAKKSGATTH